MEITITGTVTAVLPESKREYNGKIYISQAVLVKENVEQYPNTFKVEFSDKVAAYQYVKGANLGDNVTIQAEVQGREYKTKQGDPDSFMSIKGFKYTKDTGSAQQPDIQKQKQTNIADDLPF